jgi:hypothetical protein
MQIKDIFWHQFEVIEVSARLRLLAQSIRAGFKRDNISFPRTKDSAV